MNWVTESWITVVIMKINKDRPRNHMEEKSVKLGKCLMWS